MTVECPTARGHGMPLAGLQLIIPGWNCNTRIGNFAAVKLADQQVFRSLTTTTIDYDQFLNIMDHDSLPILDLEDMTIINGQLLDQQQRNLANIQTILNSSLTAEVEDDLEDGPTWLHTIIYLSVIGILFLAGGVALYACRRNVIRFYEKQSKNWISSANTNTHELKPMVPPTSSSKPTSGDEDAVPIADPNA